MLQHRHHVQTDQPKRLAPMSRLFESEPLLLHAEARLATRAQLHQLFETAVIARQRRAEARIVIYLKRDSRSELVERTAAITRKLLWRLRALVKHLDGISDEEIPSLNIPTGIPLVYELDEDLRPIASRYLGDPEAAAAAAQAVADQAKG